VPRVPPIRSRLYYLPVAVRRCGVDDSSDHELSLFALDGLYDTVAIKVGFGADEDVESVVVGVSGTIEGAYKC